ncbi:NAC domain-containing protein 22-like [Phragmites australis]|uniref:NAC domain-containing protein 22-like n=1 Tax=Phragmites australis TaxID=29695 RepID=UPI002D781C12|nr:NAC domain-containing protein 22-like [Phragmites australis]
MVRSSSPASKPPCAAFHSHPSDLELVKSYLRPWVASGLKAGTFIHEADVYAADPTDLTREFPPAVAQDGERAWYFFTPLRRKNGRGRRKARTVANGDGCWHNEAKSKPVVDGLEGRRQIGHRQSFSFVKKEGGVRVRTGWLMMELRLERDHGHGHEAPEEGSLGNLVLCKVYRSPRNPEASDNKPTAAPGLKAEADEDESSAAPAPAPGPRGKADDDESSDASLAAAASGGKRKSDNEESSEATVAAPRRHRKADDEISGAVTVAAPGRKEHAADDEDSAETSAAAPARKRKAANDDESSGAASAAAPPPKRKADGDNSCAPATELQLHCPRCGFHLDAEAVLVAAKPKSEAEIVQVDAPQGGETGDSSVKDHSFLKFL